MTNKRSGVRWFVIVTSIFLFCFFILLTIPDADEIPLESPHDNLRLIKKATSDVTVVIFGLQRTYRRINQTVSYLHHLFDNIVVFSFDNITLPFDDVPVFKLDTNWSGHFYNGERLNKAAAILNDRIKDFNTSWYLFGDDDTIIFPSSLMFHLDREKLPLDEHVFQGACITFRKFNVGGGGILMNYKTLTVLKKYAKSECSKQGFANGFDDARFANCVAYAINMEGESGFQKYMGCDARYRKMGLWGWPGNWMITHWHGYKPDNKNTTSVTLHVGKNDSFAQGIYYNALKFYRKYGNVRINKQNVHDFGMLAQWPTSNHTIMPPNTVGNWIGYPKPS